MPDRNNTDPVAPADDAARAASPPALMIYRSAAAALGAQRGKATPNGAPLPGTQGDDKVRHAKRKDGHAPAGKNTVLYVSFQGW